MTDPIGLMFAGMPKLGPGADEYTRHALNLLPRRDFEVVVDAGCGAGRTTLVLAAELQTPIHAVDAHQPFLDDLMYLAGQAGVRQWIRPRCMDMGTIAEVIPRIDLLWSEGAAYSIGFANALTSWAESVVPGGFVAVTELCWLREDPDPAAVQFFAATYPDMGSVPDVLLGAERAGYLVLDHFTLPREAWVDGYYEVLRPRAEMFLEHDDAAVRELAALTVAEIDLFDRAEGSYGYEFLVLRRR
ncbi:MAG: class I SAM-dependent methyltransferase [Sporichthyaceae bacterium]